MPTADATTLPPQSLESPSCDHTHRSLAYGSTDGLLGMGEGSDESFNDSTESPAPQTPATPQALQLGKLPPAATFATPDTDRLTRPTAAHVRAKRKPVPSVIDLLGYDPGPLPPHPLTPHTPGTPATPTSVGFGHAQRFTLGPLAGLDVPDLSQELDQGSCGRGSRCPGASAFTLQNGNMSVLSLPMRVLEVDRLSLLEGGRRANPVRRSTYGCYSTYACDYNNTRPDMSQVGCAADLGDDIVLPPPRRQSLYRSGKNISAASELAELRRITHSTSMDFDAIKQHSRSNQSSFLVGDNDSDQSSVREDSDGPVAKRLKRLSLRKKNTTNYTKTTAKLGGMSTVDEKPHEQSSGWFDWVCNAFPCMHRGKVS